MIFCFQGIEKKFCFLFFFFRRGGGGGGGADLSK